MAHATTSPTTERATFRQWLVALGAIIGAFMAILDVSITNSSLRDIQGTLGASASEGSWISTAYLVTEIIVIPLTAFLADVFSTRAYLLSNVLLFLLFSALCGTAHSLNAMIAYRAAQGFVGGALIPTAMTIVMTSLPGPQQAIGLALFGIATTFAPAIGPTLGGWLTLQYGWPFIFYINFLPGGILIFTLLRGLDREPKRLHLLRTADWSGIALIAVFLGTLTTILEEGNQEDWFSSPFIVKLTIACVLSLGLFIYRELRTANPIIDLRFLIRRNFFVCCMLSLLFGYLLYGASYLVPMYLGGVHQYNALQIGSVMKWSGLPQLLVMPFMPLLVAKIDNRKVVFVGFGMMAMSALMNSHMSYAFAGDQLIAGQFFRALGMPLIGVTLTGIAYDKIAAKDSGAASGLFNMMRNLGGSIGIGTLKTQISVRYSFHFARLSEKVTTVSAGGRHLVEATQALFARTHDFNRAYADALHGLGLLVNRESYIMAFSDCFFILMVLMMLSMALTPFLNKVKGAVKMGH